MKRQRKRAVFLVCLAALMTLASVLLISMAAMEHQEMLHEGLTQSQWYESAVRSYQKGRLWAGLAALATLALWAAALLRIRKKAHDK